MTPAELKRVFVECLGYWPHAPISKAAEVSWSNMVGDFTHERVSEALSNFAGEGGNFPPLPGQLRRRIMDSEPEIERVRRQRKQATQQLKNGTLHKDDFDWYEKTYWSKVDPQTPTQKRQVPQ